MKKGTSKFAMTCLIVAMCCTAHSAQAQDSQKTRRQTAGKPKKVDLRVRFADARWRLTKVELERAERMNKKAAGTVPGREMQRLKENIKVARRQLDVAKKQNHAPAFPAQVSAAEAALKLAERDLQAAININKRSPDMIAQIDINRLRIKMELAQIRVELWKDPGYLPSLLDQMQWQIDRLTVQVIELGERLDAQRK